MSYNEAIPVVDVAGSGSCNSFLGGDGLAGGADGFAQDLCEQPVHVLQSAPGAFVQRSDAVPVCGMQQRMQRLRMLRTNRSGRLNAAPERRNNYGL